MLSVKSTSAHVPIGMKSQVQDPLSRQSKYHLEATGL